MKTKSNQSKIDCLQSNHSCLGYSELDHSQLNHSMMVNASSIVLGGLMGLTLLSGLILSSSLTSADDTTDVVTITVPTSCSMSSSGTDSHAAEIGNGQSNSTIGETTITTYCNDNEGFAIYAIGYTGDTLGNTVLTDISLGSTHDIVTGTATSGNASNWAMKLSTISSPAPNFPIVIAGSTDDNDKEQGDPDYSSFQGVPDDYTKVAYRTSSTDVGTNAEGSILKTTYQAYISPTQSAGTYQGKVKYALVRPNTAPAPSNTPTLISTVTCTTQVPGAAYMQDINASNKATILAGMTEDAEYFLRDARDNKDYCVAKLKDGNLWMTQNLDHDIDSTKTYTSQDTDIPANWTPLASTHVTNNTEWSEYNEDTNPDGGNGEHAESYDPGDLYWNGTPNDHTPESTGNSHYHLGNYYNWTAAVAMDDSSEYGVYNDETGEYDNLEPNQSICPKGWTLPRGNASTGSFRYLMEQYGWDSNTSQLENDNKAYNAPLYFALSGAHAEIIGNYGEFWTSSAIGVFGDGYNGASLLAVGEGEGSINPDDYSDRSNPYSVRCVARP